MVGQPLQHVADVDHDGVGVGGERHPLPLLGQHLQTGGTGAHQQGDQVDVLVGAGAYVGDVVGGDRRIVDRAQDRVAEVGLVGEPVLVQADVQGQRRQDLRTQRVQRLVQAVAVLAETGHLGRPLVGRHRVAVGRIVGDFPPDVPELLEAEVLRILGRLHPERGVAARAAATGNVVLPLHLLGQGEEALERVVGRVDVGLRDTVVADPGKAPLAVGGAELGDEGRAVTAAGRRGETPDVQGGNG